MNNKYVIRNQYPIGSLVSSFIVFLYEYSSILSCPLTSTAYSTYYWTCWHCSSNQTNNRLIYLLPIRTMKRILFWFWLALMTLFPWLLVQYTHAQDANNNFTILNESVKPIEQYVDTGVTARGPEGIRDFIINTFYDIALPLVIAIGILTAMLWIYKLLFSSDESDRSKAVSYILRGVVGIVLIMSAKYITFSLLGEWWNSGILLSQWEDKVSWIIIAQDLYDKLIVPFLQIAFYLIIGVLFIILLTRVISFLWSPSDDNKKKAVTIITWNTLGILIVIGAKLIVESIYGKKDAIVNPDATNLWDIGSAALANASFPLIYTIINWVMGITSLVILIIIITQAYQLLANPEDEWKLSTVSKSLMYIFVGILVIGLGYIITNVFLVQ